MTISIELDHPVTVDGTRIGVICLRRPKVRDELAAQRQKEASAAEIEVQLFANLCDLPRTAIEDLDMADYLKLQAAYQDFRKPQSPTSAAQS